MRLHRRSASSALSGTQRFDERLSVPWWWWPVALAVVCLVTFEVRLGHPGVPTWLPVAVLAPSAAWGLFRLGATRVTLLDDRTDDGEAGERTLRVGPARLPVRLVGSVERVGVKEKQDALGPGLDPAAFLVHRPWIGPMIRATVTDAADPTPYWLFSVRRPESLIARLAAIRRE